MSLFEERHKRYMRNPVYRFWYWMASLELFGTRIRESIATIKGWRKREQQYLEGWEFLTTFRAILEKTDMGWSGYITEVPGVGVAADTEDECFDLLCSAFAFHRESYRVINATYCVYRAPACVSISE